MALDREPEVEMEADFGRKKITLERGDTMRLLVTSVSVGGVKMIPDKIIVVRIKMI
jgi:hypothetical protein